MKSEKNTAKDSLILRNWLDTVPYGDYAKIIKLLTERCLVNITTFRNWRYGRCRIPESGKRDINNVTLEISGIEIFKIAKPEEMAEGVSGHASGTAI